MTTTTSPKTITTLPDLCLLTIFDRVPLNDIMANVSLTCHRWHSLRHSICTRRTELCLRLDKQQHYSAIDDLVVGRRVLKVEQATRLFAIFNTANIGTLRLEYDGPHSRNDLIMTVTTFTMLLRLWAHKPGLHTVSFDYYFDNDPQSLPNRFAEFSDQLVRALDAMSSLQVLSIRFWLLSQSTTKPFPLLARLHLLEATLSTSASLPDLCHWIVANYRGNQRLEIKIKPTILHVEGHELVQIYQSGVPLDQFTGYFPTPLRSARNETYNYDQMHQFLGSFPRLTEFTIDNQRLDICQITRCLTQLTALRRLALHLRAPITAVATNHHQTAQSEFRALPSVRELTVRLNMFNTGDVFRPDSVDRWLSLPHAFIFPGLTVLHMHISPVLRGRNPSSHLAKCIESVLPIVKQYARPYLQSCTELRQVVLHHMTQPHSTTYTYTPEQLLLGK